MPHEIDLPDMVRNTAVGQGELGQRWLHDLPTIVAELVRRWNVEIGATLSGGTAAYVAEATTADGVAVVVKVAMPAHINAPEAFHHRVDVFTLAEGRGLARLLLHDEELDALMLERLGPNLDSLGLPVRRQLEIISATVQQVWVPVPPHVRLPTGAEKAAWLADSIVTMWRSLERPCAARTVEIAVAYAAERACAYDRDTAVLVHGDAHSWNTLQAGDGEFKLVDPEGLVSEPAHDLAVPMREMHDDLLAGDAHRLGRDRAQLLADLTGVDREAIWQWGFIERVSTGLYCLQLGEPAGHDFLEVADRWAKG